MREEVELLPSGLASCLLNGKEVENHIKLDGSRNVYNILVTLGTGS